MTILLIPFMSCSAKLPVYGLLSAAFFGPWAGLVVFGLSVPAFTRKPFTFCHTWVSILPREGRR